MATPRQVPLRVIAVYWVASSALVAVINLVLFPGPVFDPVTRATGGLVNATLQANLLNLALLALVVMGWGGLRPGDVGLDRGRLRQGVLLTAGLWLAAQLIVLAIDAVNGEVALDPAWAIRGGTVMVGGLVAQLLGNALFEEAAYRGFYLGQLESKLASVGRLGARGRTAAAAGIALALFVLSHVPNRIFAGLALADMPADFAFLVVLGLFFTVVYRVSGNLFLAIGVHALMNRPTLLTVASLPAGYLIGALAAVLVAGLWLRGRRTAAAGIDTGRLGPMSA